MRKKLIASVGIAGLLLIGLPTVATAATDTITDTPVEPIGVDDSAIARSLTVSTAGDVTDVTVMVDFQTHDGQDCSVLPGTGNSYPDELALGLESPAGTLVSLVYSWQAEEDESYPAYDAPAERVQVTFSDAADAVVGSTNGGAPETGTFRPATPLSAFHGEAAAGEWLLHFADVDGADVKCYYGAALTVTTDAVDDEIPAVAPTPPAKVETARA